MWFGVYRGLNVQGGEYSLDGLGRSGSMVYACRSYTYASVLVCMNQKSEITTRMVRSDVIFETRLDWLGRDLLVRLRESCST